MAHFNQIQAAHKIHDAFANKQLAHVCLMAQMQQGKTGVATEVIRLCMNQAAPIASSNGCTVRSKMVLEVLWLSCSNDVELAEQSKERIKEYN